MYLLYSVLIVQVEVKLVCLMNVILIAFLSSLADAGDNLLFVVGGFQHVSSVEVVDLSGRNRNCSTPADFPTYQYHGVGVKSSGVPFVCAGTHRS